MGSRQIIALWAVAPGAVLTLLLLRGSFHPLAWLVFLLAWSVPVAVVAWRARRVPEWGALALGWAAGLTLWGGLILAGQVSSEVVLWGVFGLYALAGAAGLALTARAAPCWSDPVGPFPCCCFASWRSCF